MDYSDEIFEVEFTQEYIEEMNEIYHYISMHLKNDIAAARLISKVNEKILILIRRPEIYMKVGKANSLKRQYRKIIVNNFIVLYAIDYHNKKVYISHMIYSKRNYLNEL